MSDFAEIRLPYGKKFVTVGEIPVLIAAALHPEVASPTERTIRDLLKLTHHSDGQIAGRARLSSEDWAHLNSVWSSLPPYKDGITESVWTQYAAATDAAAERLGWRIEPQWHDDPREVSALARTITEEQQREHLHKVILAGAVQAYSPGMTPYSPTLGTSPSARILVDEFARYLERDIPMVRVSVEWKPDLEIDEARISALVDAHVANTNEPNDDDADSFDDYGEDRFTRGVDSPEDATAPVSRQRWQENEILRVIESLGYSAMALPPNAPGKKGAPFHVRTQCQVTNPSQWNGSVFDKAWARLSAQKRIQYAE